jgi:Flp pilus assembly secretin CpaC
LGLRKWSTVALLAAGLVCGLVATVRQARAGQEVVIVVGKSATIRPDFPIGNGANSNPTVLESHVDGNTIILFGKKTGSATYVVYDARSRNRRVEYDVRVVSEDLGRVRDDLQRQIGDIEGVEVQVRGDQVIVEGDVALESELLRINKLTNGRANVQNLVRLSPLAVKALARTIEQNIGRPDVTARPLKDKILLEGVVYSDEQKTRAEAIATTLYQNVVDVIEVQQVQRPPSRAKTIVLNTHFLELSKQLLDTWSVNWQTVAITPGGVTGFFQQDLVNGELVGDFNTTISGTITAFLPKLERAKPEGIIRTLANPVVTTKDGSEASIFSGEEVPFVIGTTPTGVPIVDFKKVGINVSATPYAQGDSVDLKLSVSVSDVGTVSLADSGAATTGIVQSSFETSQFTRAGESVAIGGLFRVSDNVLYNKTRNDRDPNSIFQLFLSREYQKRKGQFIVFITPSVYDDSVSANREMKDLFNLQEVGQ